MKNMILTLLLLLSSANMSAQQNNRHALSYEPGFVTDYNMESVWFSHELNYAYWLKPYMGVKGGIRLDKPGRAVPDLSGYGEIDGYPNSQWWCAPPMRLSLVAGAAFATPALKIKNSGIFLFCDPKLLLSLPVSAASVTVDYPNGICDTKIIKGRADWISAEIDMGITFKFKLLSISPGYSISLHDPFSGYRRMKIGTGRVADALPTFEKFNHRFFLRFTIPDVSTLRD